MDGVHRPTCKPGPREPPPGTNHHQIQREAYSRYKKGHGENFLGLTDPSGLMIALYGPSPARYHDANMYGLSRWGDTINNHDAFNGYFVYADSAFPLQRRVLKPFQNPEPNSPEAQWNYEMSRVRITNEWGFWSDYE